MPTKMTRRLPKLRPEVRVETTGAGDSLVVRLSLDGERPKRVSGQAWGAIALLDSYDDVESWKRAARKRDLTLTDAKLDKLLEALEQNGFAIIPGEAPKDRLSRPMAVQNSQLDAAPVDVEVSELVDRRSAFSADVTQVVQIPTQQPMIRRDLRVMRSERPNMVRIVFSDGRRVEVPEREYDLLLELDGRRDLVQIHAHLVSKGATFSFEQLSTFIASMVRQGIVIEDAGHGPPPPPEVSTAELPNEQSSPVTPEPPRSAGAASPAEHPGAASPAEHPVVEEAPPPEEQQAPAQTEGAWDQADQVTASPEAKQRRRTRRIKQLIRVLALPAVLLIAGSVVRYPLTVTYECEIEPLESRTVRSPIEGVIAAIAVDEGQRVEANQVLGNLDNAAVELDLVKNKAALERAIAELDLLKQGSRKEELDRAKAKISGLENQAGIAAGRLSRVRDLVRKGVAPREEQDKASAELAAINGQLKQARADLVVLKAGARPDDLRKKEAEINSLKAQVDLSEKQLAATVLKAPMAGVVTTQKPKEKINTKVNVGDPIIEIVSPEKMRATVLVSERDFDVLKKGLPMKVKLSAYPVDEFTGEVIRIAEKVERRDTGNIIRTEGVIDNKDGKLVPHMTGFAEIQGEPRPVVSLLARRVLRWVRVRFLI
jgi:multidrug resistance efflux pump